MEGPIALQIAIVVAMVAVSAWGWVRIPADARFPIRFGGASGWQTTLGKTTGLILWPLLGVVVAWGTGLASEQENSMEVLGLVTSFFLLLVQFSGVRRLVE